MAAFGLYVHIPFCPQHCPYCGFAVVTGHVDLYERYVAAVCRDIQQWKSLAPRGPLHTVFFGGGTPSMLAPAHIHTILDTAQTVIGIAADAEISLEANPTTADMQKFQEFREAGCNRLSLGVQSFEDVDLRRLGRRHTAAEAERATLAARQAGFSNLNLDVMFGTPGSSRALWQSTVHKLLEIHPEHVSTYGLTIEEGTHFAARYAQGKLQLLSEDEEAWAYTWAMDRLHEAGYEHYEVSNFARPGHRSRHNWGYWHGASYIGVGMSAHSFVAGQRRWNTPDLMQYMAALEAGESACVGCETIDHATARRERLWLQLRTCDGAFLEPDELQGLRQAAKFQAMLDTGLLQLDAARLRLTPRGFPLADAIGVELVDIVERAREP